MKEIALIQTFESVFIEAANLAKKLKSSATKSNKLHSGNAEVDIVTSADLEVQEFVLKKLVKSDLVNCELVAEESTESIGLFSKKAKYVITLDPIDGTKNYANGTKNYSIIVGLHDKKRPIYTFDYYPEHKWGIKIVNDRLSFIGTAPKIDTPKHPKTITTYLDITAPQKTIPNLYKKLSDAGYCFVNKRTITEKLGATSQFILEIADGYYVENGSAVDCLTGLHFALASKLKVYQDIDISKTIKSSMGSDIYRGYYLVIRE